MSLKAFHIVFILASILLAFGFGWWAWEQHRTVPTGPFLCYAVGSALAGMGLTAYLVAALRKLRGLSYV